MRVTQRAVARNLLHGGATVSSCRMAHLRSDSRKHTEPAFVLQHVIVLVRRKAYRAVERCSTLWRSRRCVRADL